MSKNWPRPTSPWRTFLATSTRSGRRGAAAISPTSSRFTTVFCRAPIAAFLPSMNCQTLRGKFRSGCSTSCKRATSRSKAIRCVCRWTRSEEHTSELQSRLHLVCRLLLEKKKKNHTTVRLKTHRTIYVSSKPYLNKPEQQAVSPISHINIPSCSTVDAHVSRRICYSQHSL